MNKIQFLSTCTRIKALNILEMFNDKSTQQKN